MNESNLECQLFGFRIQNSLERPWECSYVTYVWFTRAILLTANILAYDCNLRRPEASYCIYISIVSTFPRFGVLTS
jgi:hypothetical protein